MSIFTIIDKYGIVYFMKFSPNKNTQPLSPGHRFNNLWAILSTGDSEEEALTHFDTGAISTGTYTDIDGENHGLIVRTVELPSLPGTLWPAERVIEVMFDNGSNFSLNDVIVAGNPEQDVIDRIEQLEGILSTFR